MGINLLEPEIASSRPVLSQDRFLRLLLLQGAATRHELGKQSGFSASSITLRSQWLMERGFLQKSSERLQHSKRPVETLSLRTQPWSTLAVRLTADSLCADTLDSTGNVESSFSQPLHGNRPAAIFTEFGKAYLIAKERGEQLGRPIRGIALSVDGVISEPRAGMIFQINKLKDWVPCQPKFMHPAIPNTLFLSQWTASTCKLHGLARQLKTDNRIAYFHIDQTDLHLATIHEGIVTLGSHGTSGYFLHQTLQPDGPPCYCGRSGCLDASLRAGKATPAMIYGAIQRLLEQSKIEHLGLEWPGCPENIQEAFRASVPRSVVMIQSGTELERSGLALLATETALLRETEALQSTSA